MSENHQNIKETERLLEVKNLKVSFFTHLGEVKAVNDISYYIKRREIIAIVGESGCGKSVSQMAILKLIPSPPGKIIGGEVLFEGNDVLKYDMESKRMRLFRGGEISMIFQEPMTSLNPVFTVGDQMVEIIRAHKNVSRKEAWKIGIESLMNVGISNAEKRMKNYPFELSGGMCQRVLIAISIACNSKLIIADEPTTALDATTQAQVMELLLDVVHEYKRSLILITHNLGLVSRYAERIYVMYAGKFVESGITKDLLSTPKHPYTMGLLKSVPRLESDKDIDLVSIKGSQPNPTSLPRTCFFLPRCPYACDICRKEKHPTLRKVGENENYVACHLDIGKK